MSDLIPAVSYRRVSTTEQADTGFSLPKQLEAINRYALDHGLTIVADYAEDVSGMTPVELRPEGSKMIDLLSRRGAVAIIAHEVDRLSRDIVNLLSVVQKWLRLGIQVHTCDMGHVKSELDIALVIKAWQGGAEHQRILERTTRGKQAKAESGKWIGGVPPYGYVQQGFRRDARMVIDESEAEIVRRVYRWYTVDRLPMLEIADRLNRQGVTTRKGTRWWKAMVKKMLSNETYIGVVYYAGIRIDLPELALIPREMYDRAQELKRINRERSARNTKHDHEYLLSGHFRCQCGQTMTGATPGPGGGKRGADEAPRTYYRCAQFQWPASKRDCPLSAPFASGVVAESIVWSYLRELVKDEDLLRTSIEELNAAHHAEESSGADEIAELDRKIAALNRKIDLQIREFGNEADEDAVKVSRATIRSAQRERDEAKVKRAMLMSTRQEVGQRESGQAAILKQIEAWRGLIDRADYLFKRDVLDLLDVRVRFIAADSGFAAAAWSSPRAIEITTALTAPRAFEYAMERRWRKQQKAA